jgi:MFS family permease
MALITGGLLWLSRIGINTTGNQLTVRMLVVGAGLGLGMPIFNLIVQNAFPHSRLGVATASVQMFRTIGATIGVAIMGSILDSSLRHHLSHAGLNVSVNQLSNTTGEHLPLLIRTALASSISEVFLLSGLVVSLAFFAALFLKEVPLRSHETHPTATEGGVPGAATAIH